MNLIQCFLTNNSCYRTGKRIKPKGVMVHSTGANNTSVKRYVQPAADDPKSPELLKLIGVNRNANDWNNTKREVCVHAFIGKIADGSVGIIQTLPWDMRAWHSGRGNKGSANDTHISFEICEDGLTDRAYFENVYDKAVQLTAMLCEENGFDPMEDGVLICHSEGYERGIASNHGDVMHWFPKHGKSMDSFRADVAAKMAKKDEDEDMDVNRFKELWREMRKELQDNDAGTWSEDARRWAVENGIVAGGSTSEFNGMWEDVLTREQMVTLLYRFAKLVGQA